MPAKAVKVYVIMFRGVDGPELNEGYGAFLSEENAIKQIDEIKANYAYETFDWYYEELEVKDA